MNFSEPSLRASGESLAQATIRDRNEDFEVDEVLRFEPDGEGGHVWLHVEKSGINTVKIAKNLARFAGVRTMDVGFAGQKDRHAVTRQWFSINLGTRAEPDWEVIGEGGVRVLDVSRHGKKLRRGQLLGNRFRITLRNLEAEPNSLIQRLEQVARDGVPNYFGPQRFGRGNRNLMACAELFDSGKRLRDRYRRSMYFSAARAWLFNRVLSERVRNGSWNCAIPGDILMFDDSRSRFVAKEKEELDDPRLGRLELHPTGPLWGRGSPECEGEPAGLENAVARAYLPLSEGLLAAGLESDRRPLRLAVKDLTFRFERDDELQMEFFLRAGAFATTVLDEIAEITDVAMNGRSPADGV